MKRHISGLRARRKARVRSKIFGTAERPRLSVFRSNRFTYAQLIDDEKGRTLVSASTRAMKRSKRMAQALELGRTLGEKAAKHGVKNAVFDKGMYKYHGRVKAVAEGIREKGLKV